MGSRILADAKANTKVTICCTFMILAAASAFACPYASAAGIQTFGLLSADGGIIQDNVYVNIQSTGDVGFLSPGQETLTHVITDGMVSTGRSGTKYNTTIDANDHEIYKGDKTASYLDGGMTWDTAYTEGIRNPLPVNNTGESGGATNNTTPIGDTVENTTVIMRPYHEEMSVEKNTIGSSGQYMSDKMVEQGSNESQDYIMLNAKATGLGSFSNDVNTRSEVGFIGASDNVNLINENSQHEVASGHYNATSYTLLESFSNAYMTPTFTTEEEQQIQSISLGVT